MDPVTVAGVSLFLIAGRVTLIGPLASTAAELNLLAFQLFLASRTIANQSHILG